MDEHNSKIAARKMKVMETLTWLFKQFPAAFSAEKPRPLKLHIHQDIFNLLPTLNNAPSKKKIRDTILFYTKTSEYLQATTKYQFRIDLNGKFVGEITKEQHDFALQSLKNRNFNGKSRAALAETTSLENKSLDVNNI